MTNRTNNTTSRIDETTNKINRTAEKIDGTTDRINETANKIDKTTKRIYETTGKIDESAQNIIVRWFSGWHLGDWKLRLLSGSLGPGVAWKVESRAKRRIQSRSS